MPTGQQSYHVCFATVSCLLLICAMAQGQPGAATTPQSDAASRIDGIIANRDSELITVRTLTGEEIVMQLTGSTIILESDTGKAYNRDALIPGLYLGVTFHKTKTGQAIAEKVTFTQQDLKLARIIQAQIDSVRDRVTTVEEKLNQIEANSQRLSGQLEELAAVSNAARGGAKGAQATADTAIAAINSINAMLPEFPWPPPRASATALIPRKDVLGHDGPPTLSHASQRLRTALNEAGYSELSWFAVPGGFALTTRIEQIKSDGRPARGTARWSVSDVPSIQGPSDYIRALFTANPGHYRVIVFIVTDRPLSQTDETVSELDATAWRHRGMTALPEQIGAAAFSAAHNCTALIYHFKRAINQPPAYVDSSPLPGLQHLQQSGFWRGLTR